MNEELIKIQPLRLNTSKTTFMIFSPKIRKFDNANKIKLQLGQQDIELVNLYKYLNVTSDSNLNWKPHVFKPCDYVVSEGRNNV